MAKMRESTGVILWVLIFSFGILWVLADTQFFDAIQAGPRSLGSVNGEAVSYEEYNNLINSYSRQYSQQTGNSMNAEQRASYEEQAWDDLVTRKLLEQKMDQLGITVTDQEVVNMITGENPDPFIRQQFGGEDGTIDRTALQNAINSPENSEVWIAIEQQLRQKRRQQKMTSFMQSGMVVSSHEVERRYVRNNSSADISYVRFPYADISEEEIGVSEQELRDYYQDNQDAYHRNESYEFRYASFDKTPTAQDTARTYRELSNLREDFAQAEDDSLFLNRYQSTTPYNNEYVAKGDVREIFQRVTEMENGEVSEVIRDDGRAHLIKKLDETAEEVQFVVLSFDITADPINTIDERAEQADDFSFFAQEDGFQAEAERRELNLRQATATSGNTFVAGIGQSQQILSFLEGASEGQISEPLELSNQFVVIQVEEIIPAGPRPFEEVREQIRTAVVNQKRRDMMAERVSGMLGGSLEGLAESAGREISTAEGLTMNSVTIPGAGREPGVVGAAIGMEEGSLSGVVRGNNAVFVLRVDTRNQADPASLTDAMREQIRQQLRQQKSASFMQVWLEQLRENADIQDNRSRVLQQS
ncbi:MAG: SurA N-terminal domain-containing protein [Balneolaceae bacterium]|nr:SurA N-terminal domain-containing protein [Balneolaceae bacterium]